MNTDLKTFAALREQVHILLREYFHYLQIAHFFRSIIWTRSSLTSQSFYEGICNFDPHAPGVISHLYSHLTSPLSKLPSYTAQWARDLEIDLVLEDWDAIWVTTKSSTQNILALETNYKVLMRWYLVLVRIDKFLSGYSPLCFRECDQEGTHLSGGNAPSCSKFGLKFSKWPPLVNFTLDPDPSLALLNHNTLASTKPQFCFILQLMLKG